MLCRRRWGGGTPAFGAPALPFERAAGTRYGWCVYKLDIGMPEITNESERSWSVGHALGKKHAGSGRGGSGRVVESFAADRGWPACVFFLTTSLCEHPASAGTPLVLCLWDCGRRRCFCFPDAFLLSSFGSISSRLSLGGRRRCCYPCCCSCCCGQLSELLRQMDVRNVGLVR